MINVVDINDVFDTLNDFYKKLKGYEYDEEFLNEFKVGTNAIDRIEDFVFYELTDFFEQKFSNKEKFTVINADNFKFKLKIDGLLTDELDKFIDDYIKYERKC